MVAWGASPRKPFSKRLRSERPEAGVWPIFGVVPGRCVYCNRSRDIRSKVAAARLRRAYVAAERNRFVKLGGQGRAEACEGGFQLRSVRGEPERECQQDFERRLIRNPTDIGGRLGAG